MRRYPANNHRQRALNAQLSSKGRAVEKHCIRGSRFMVEPMHHDLACSTEMLRAKARSEERSMAWEGNKGSWEIG